MALNKRSQALRGGSFYLFLFYGVVTYGVAMFLFFASYIFFQWRFSDAWALGFVPVPFNSATRMLVLFGTSIGFGSLLGLGGWKRSSNGVSSSSV
jgi:hypothetical protein